MQRRDLLRGAAASAVGLALGPDFWRAAYAAPAAPGPGPYGALGPADANGVRLPEGFRSRVVAVSGEPVGASGYTWHPAPDGAATFAADDGGWFHAVNSETNPGGVGVLRFDADGQVVDAYRVLDGTRRNCAGGATPWGTWLSCEETDLGLVYECAVDGPGQGVARPALGAFAHEAVAVDPERGHLYLTEDRRDGRYYRFTPDAYPDLDRGVLAAAQLDADGLVTWIEVPDVAADPRDQVPEATVFLGGEGVWHDPADGGWVYFTTKHDDTVWAHDLTADRIAPLYRASEHAAPPLTGVDNVLVAPSGDLLIAEDGGDLEVVLIAADTRDVAPLLRLEGREHRGSELTGPCFSPDGARLYVSSQRGGRVGSRGGDGVTFEITGPFRTDRVGIAATGASGEPPPAVVPDAGGDFPTIPAALGAAAVIGGATVLGLRRRQNPTAR